MNLLKSSFPASNLINANNFESKALLSKVQAPADMESHNFLSLLGDGKEIGNFKLEKSKEAPQLEEHLLPMSFIAGIPTLMAGATSHPIANENSEAEDQSGLAHNFSALADGLLQLRDSRISHQEQKTTFDFTLSYRPTISLKEIDTSNSMVKFTGTASDQLETDVDFLNPTNFQKTTIGNPREAPTQVNFRLPYNSADQTIMKAIGPSSNFSDEPIDRASLPISNGIQKTTIVPVLVPSTVPNAILPIIQNSVSQQIIHAVLLQVPTGSTGIIQPAQTIAVQLMPKNLGIVEITISRSNRQLNIVVETNRTETEKLLRIEISTISKLLTGVGFSMEDVTVRHNPHLDPVLNSQKEHRALDSNLADEAVSWDFNQTNNNNPETKSRQLSKSQMQNNELLSSIEPEATLIKEHRIGIYL